MQLEDKCCKIGHKANKCPLKEKITQLEDKRLQKIMISLLIQSNLKALFMKFEHLITFLLTL